MESGLPIGGEIEHRGWPHRGDLLGASFSECGEHLITATEGSIFEILKIGNQGTASKEASVGFGLGIDYQGQPYSRDGKWLTEHDRSKKTLNIYRSSGGVGTGPQTSDPVFRVKGAVDWEFSPDSATFVVVLSDGNTEVFQPATGSRLGSPLEMKGHIDCAGFSSDGRWLVTVSWAERLAQIWDAATLSQVGSPVPSGHPSGKFMSEGIVVGNSSADGTLIVVMDGWRARVLTAATGKVIGQPIPDFNYSA